MFADVCIVSPLFIQLYIVLYFIQIWRPYDKFSYCGMVCPFSGHTLIHWNVWIPLICLHRRVCTDMKICKWAYHANSKKIYLYVYSPHHLQPPEPQLPSNVSHRCAHPNAKCTWTNKQTKKVKSQSWLWPAILIILYVCMNAGLWGSKQLQQTDLETS